MIRQTLHIFRKDFRRFWPYCAALCLILVLHAIFDVRSTPQGLQIGSRDAGLITLVNLLLPLCIWIFIALLVLEEPLVGERQFWITRPYSWKSLLLAKIVFVGTFVNLPLLVSDCAILGAQGLPVLTVTPQLLLRQVHIALVFLVPAFTLAAVSDGVVQFVLFVVSSMFILEFSSLLTVWITQPSTAYVSVNFLGPGFFVALTSALAAAAVFQYGTRATWKTRAGVLSLFVLLNPLSVFIPFHPPEAEQTKNRLDPAAVEVHYDASASLSLRETAGDTSQPIASIVLPLNVRNLPAGTLLRGRSRMRVFSAGKPLILNRSDEYAGEIRLVDGNYIQSQFIDRSYLRLRNQRLDLESSLTLEIVNDRPSLTLPAPASTYTLPGIAVCRSFRNRDAAQIACRNGLNTYLETTLQVKSPTGKILTETTLNPQGVPWAFSPVTDAPFTQPFSLPSGSIIQFIPRDKLAEFHRTLRLQSVVPVESQQEK